MLNVVHVSTEYDRVPMLRDVNMQIQEGHFVCLLGSNGAGKTTTVKTILGLVKPTEGAVYFKGKRIDLLRTNKIVEMGISVVPEGRRLFSKMSVLENLKLGAYLLKGKDEIQERLERVFRLFPRLKERIGQTAGTLSGGEQTMVTVGRGVMGSPEILLLDEPSLGLAPKLVNEFFEDIDRINREEKITVLLIEQNAVKALSVADYGYILQKGRIIAEGETRDLMATDIVKRAYLSSGE